MDLVFLARELFFYYLLLFWERQERLLGPWNYNNHMPDSYSWPTFKKERKIRNEVAAWEENKKEIRDLQAATFFFIVFIRFLSFNRFRKLPHHYFFLSLFFFARARAGRRRLGPWTRTKRTWRWRGLTSQTVTKDLTSSSMFSGSCVLTLQTLPLRCSPWTSFFFLFLFLGCTGRYLKRLWVTDLAYISLSRGHHFLDQAHN